MSGILQQGYSFGYVLAACCNLGVGGSTNSWKIVFWIGTALSIAVGLVRILFPESQQFIEAKKAGKQSVSPGAFWLETKKMLAKEWRMCIYCILLMTWFNYVSSPCADPRLLDNPLTSCTNSTATPHKTATQPSSSRKKNSATPPPAAAAS